MLSTLGVVRSVPVRVPFPGEEAASACECSDTGAEHLYAGGGGRSIAGRASNSALLVRNGSPVLDTGCAGSFGKVLELRF